MSEIESNKPIRNKPMPLMPSKPKGGPKFTSTTNVIHKGKQPTRKQLDAAVKKSASLFMPKGPIKVSPLGPSLSMLNWTGTKGAPKNSLVQLFNENTTSTLKILEYIKKMQENRNPTSRELDLFSSLRTNADFISAAIKRTKE
jgi:hypothetical protein